MSRAEWFRKTTWSASDEKTFFARLASSRKDFHRAQYLRIQAVHLFDTGDVLLVRAALALLERLLVECPEPSQLALAYLQMARCHEQLGACDAAVDAFRRALSVGGVDPHFAIEFAWFIVQHQLHALHDEALVVLEDANPAFLPIQTFKVAAVRALIAESRGDHRAAAQHAQHAVEAAALQASPFRYHQHLGLVGTQHPEVVERLLSLSNSRA